MSHSELCELAVKWLRGSRRCNPVFMGIASCDEIPDVIGWASAYSHRGSTVVECKTSANDFTQDKWKYVAWKHPEFNWLLPSSRIGVRQAKKEGYAMIPLPQMGDFRFFLAEPSVVTVEMVEKHYPNHGLLYPSNRGLKVVRVAPRRTDLLDKDSEIRYLRFAIINRKDNLVDATFGKEEIQMKLEGCVQ